jgi:hypothetical protein
MAVGNLIGISNVTGADLDTVINEFERQQAQLAKLGEFDVTTFDAFRQTTTSEPQAQVVAVDFAGPKRVVNFFSMLTQAHAHYAPDAVGVTVFEATGAQLTVKVSAGSVTVAAGASAVAAYIRSVVTAGYTA